jgi:hypothetical protein
MCGAPDQATIDRSGIADGATVIQGVATRGGEPVAGGYVRLLDSGDEFTAEVVTSATGQFRFFTRPGDWTVRLIGGASGDSVSAAVTVAEGEVSEVAVAV